MISHRASLTFVNWAYDYFQVQSTDRVSNHAPFHFDLSVFDLFTGIQAGATVVLVPPGLSVFPQSLASFIAKQRITIWYSVPSLLIQLTLRGNLYQHHFASLRAILFAGEVFPIKYLRQLVEQIPHPKYYNLYGPTETNVCTCYAVTETDLAPERVEPLPIGQVCANSEVMVLNEQQQRLQPGEIGELYVRGPSLMKGYLGMPQKSRAVLLPYVLDPALGPETIYRTGDLVKQVADGTYLFLGRRDNMIKSRGYRIELGEIETALYDHPAVEEVAVVAIPDDQRTNVIKAVVVIRDDRTLHTRDLEYFCAGRLPAYMIPSIIEIRAKLPKTSTGKVDKTRLHQQMDGLST
jgi:acyl-coenzyme A synthetase/AMP-(fatty) acid ligase